MIISSAPKIIKAPFLFGSKLVFRDANNSDADFIYSLRVDERKSKFLNLISSELDDQISWLSDYSEKLDQAYFIIENENNEKLGTVRLYDAVGDSFSWGSWIVKDDAPFFTALESALMVYSYAIDVLNFRKAHFSVRKNNIKVCNFHERFGAKIIDQDDDNYFFSINYESISVSRDKYKKILPNGISFR